MLASHREQENLVYSHQVPTKQAPKTPGSRYPKTPSAFGRRDENALGGVGGKGAAVGDGKLFVKGLGANQIAMTPSAPQTRAVLGDKTTNAKARTAHGKTGGPRDLDKSQARQSPVRRHRPIPASFRKLFLAPSREVGPEYDEPEYAPPRPKELPYQSDVLPKGGLSFEGIKKGNLLKGFYQHFHDAVDDRGLSRYDQLFDDEMATVLEEAVRRNNEQTRELSWGFYDIHEAKRETDKLEQPKRRPVEDVLRKKDASITSRHAAVALASRAPSGSILLCETRSSSSTGSFDLALSAPAGTTVGEAASRTSIGYARGRSTSSVLHPRDEATESFSARAKRVVPIIDGGSSPMVTTTCLSPAVPSDGSSIDAEELRPAFMSIFDGHLDNCDLARVSFPFEESDEEEEFQMRLEI